MLDILEERVDSLPIVTNTNVEDFIRSINGRDAGMAVEYAQKLVLEKKPVAFALEMISEHARRPKPAPITPLKYIRMNDLHFTEMPSSIYVDLKYPLKRV